VGAFGRGGGRNHFGNAYGWAGGTFWPYYYDDALDYALWPDGFYDPFFDYGPDDLFAGLFWPGYGYDYGYGYGADNYYSLFGGDEAGLAKRHRRGDDIDRQANAAETCAAAAPGGLTDVPVARISKAIQPSADQTQMLDDLKSAVGTADDILKSACPSQPPLTPVSRVAAMSKRLDATEQALNTMRPPLIKLYDSLGDEQKRKFDAIVLGRHRSPRHEQTSPDGALAQCKARSQAFANLPAQQISDELKPTGEQKTAFDALKSATDQAATTVENACPATMPDSITARFAAVDARLKAMRTAVDTISPKLKDFYATLSDDQKAQFNLMTAPQSASAGRG
jgi:hypothetical protein